MLKNILNLNEKGRSMVEILGVLAIMGVLSVTAITGYRMALDKYRANELLSAASMRAVTVATQLQLDQQPNLNEYNSSAGFGDVEFADNDIPVNEVKGEFAIKIKNVPQKLCRQLKIQANDINAYVAENNCTQDITTVKLVFDKRLDKPRGSQEVNE